MAKYPKFGKTGQQGFHHVGKYAGKFGNLTKYETKLNPYEFGYGTVWATSLRGAKIKLHRILGKEYKKMGLSTPRRK